MHVAYIHQHFSTRAGKTGTRSYELSRCLIAAGHKVSMICGVAEQAANVLKANERVTRMQIDGIDVHCINEPYANKMGFWRRIQAFLSFANTAAKVASEVDADIVFATSTPLTVGIPGVKAARRRGVPFVFEVRDLWPELPIAMGVIKNPLIKWYTKHLERKFYRNAEHVVGLSPGICEGIMREGVPRDCVSMIPNASDLDVFTPDEAPLDDPRFGAADELRLCFTGAHGMANGLDAVLDAAVELKRRGERGIRFCFIGQGRERPALMERAQREGLNDCTSWLELIPKLELARVLPRMDVGMMILKNVPAFYYGTSPNKFFDYIAAGIPVLNNYPGWLAGMIEQHKCGVVVPPDDPKAFADACVWFRDHRAELPAMGACGRALAEAQFNRQELGTQFVSMLERVHANWTSGKRRR